MVFVVKYFRRNHLKKKKISRKYFSAFSSDEKIKKKMKMQLSLESGNVQLPLPDSGHFGQIRQDQWPDPSKSWPFWLDSTGSMAEIGQIRLDSSQIRLASDHGRILAKFGRNLVRRRPAMMT
jgi:hypothetical protein